MSNAPVSVRCSSLLLAGALLLGGSSAYAASMPHPEDFDAHTPGDDIGVVGASDGWTVKVVGEETSAPGKALVTTAAFAPDSSPNSLVINEADVELPFDSPANRKFTYVEFYARPNFGPEADIPTDASVVFYVNASSNLVAYDGQDDTVFPGEIDAGTWVKFGVAANYNTKKYSLYTNDVVVAPDFDFYDLGAGDFNAFVVRADSGAANPAYIDSLDVRASNPNFQTTNAIPEQPDPGDVTIVMGDATPGGEYRVLYSDGDPAGPFVELFVDTVGGSPPFTLIDEDVLNDPSVTTRFYRVQDTASGDINETIWVMHRQRRAGNRWYALGSPVSFGDSNLNRLDLELGTQIARGLVGGVAPGDSPRLFVWDPSVGPNGDWVWFFFEADSGTWRENAPPYDLAEYSVPPGRGMWLRTYNQVGTANAVFSGYEPGTADPITIKGNQWNLFAWPHAASRKESDNPGDGLGWGFAAAGGTQGGNWSSGDLLYIEKPSGETRNLFLNASGRWVDRFSQTPMPNVTLEPGYAYYYYRRGADLTWTPVAP